MSRRTLAILAATLAIVIAAYVFVIRDKTVAAAVQVPQLTATIGSGSEAIGVSANGAVVRWMPLPEEPPLPVLPLAEPPKGGRVSGPALQQVRVLAAAPPALRPYLSSTHYGESGVDVELDSGIELRFGDASLAAKKWAAAATVLADPAITALDYVDLHAPNHPAVYGEGHALPALP
jgi:cell division septal protein FtsQ